MMINYNAVPKKNPSDRVAPAKYYSQLKPSEVETLHQIMQKNANHQKL